MFLPRCPLDDSSAAAATGPFSAEGRRRLRAAATFCGGGDAERLLAIKQANAHELPPRQGRPREAALFLSGSAANHACVPNLSTRIERDASSGDDAPLLTYVAVTPISQGDELTVCYASRASAWTKPTELRRAQLEADYLFRCNCALCAAPDLCRAITARCAACSRGAFAPTTPATPRQAKSVWACLGCGAASDGDDPVGIIACVEATERSIRGTLDACRTKLDAALATGDGEAVRRLDPRPLKKLLRRVEKELGPTHHALDDTLVLLARLNRAHAHIQAAALEKVPADQRAQVAACMPPAFAPYGSSTALQEEATAHYGRASRLAVARRDAHAARRPHGSCGSGLWS